MRASEPDFNYFLEPTNDVNETPKVSFADIEALGEPQAGTGLGDPEHRPHNESENWNAQPLVCEYLVDIVTNISILGENLSCFYLIYNFINEFKSFSVRKKNRFLA